MKTRSRMLMLALPLVTLGVAGCASTADQKQVRTIYHINEGLEQASNGLRNARNHLAADPKAHITFVAHSKGIDFLLDGAKDNKGNPYDAMVDDLASKGVEFKVCENTLNSRHLDKTKVIMNATTVPSGVAEIGRLQTYEGYSYLKP